MIRYCSECPDAVRERSCTGRLISVECRISKRDVIREWRRGEQPKHCPLLKIDKKDMSVLFLHVDT